MLESYFKAETGFQGLIPLVRSYIALSHLEPEEYDRLNEYLDLISGKSSGELHTAASWIRSFVSNHPEYRHDSIVSESVTFDLCEAVKGLDGTAYLRRGD